MREVRVDAVDERGDRRLHFDDEEARKSGADRQRLALAEIRGSIRPAFRKPPLPSSLPRRAVCRAGCPPHVAVAERRKWVRGALRTNGGGRGGDSCPRRICVALPCKSRCAAWLGIASGSPSGLSPLQRLHPRVPSQNQSRPRFSPASRPRLSSAPSAALRKVSMHSSVTRVSSRRPPIAGSQPSGWRKR